MVRDANLAIGTHTTVFVASTLYSANVGPINLGMAGLPLQPSLQLVVHCTAAAGREVTVEAQVSIDNAVTWKALGKVIVPINKRGQFAGNIGRELRLPFVAGTVDVQVRAVVTAPADVSVVNGTFQMDLGIGERTDPQQ